MKTKIRIVWNGMGGELDSVTVDVHRDDDTAVALALINLVRGQVVSAGDSFTVQEVE